MSEVATRSGDSADRQRSHRAASYARLADSQRCSPAKLAPLRGERQQDQAHASSRTGRPRSPPAPSPILSPSSPATMLWPQSWESLPKCSESCAMRLQPKAISSLFLALSCAAKPSTRWSPTAHRSLQSSSASAIMPTRVARLTWDSIPTCFPDIIQSPASSQVSDAWKSEIPTTPGLALPQMLDQSAAGKLQALWVVGSNPAARYSNSQAFSRPFLVVQDMFLTETAQHADVFLPAAFAYEKAGTMTNTCGDLQRLKKASDVHGVKADFEIIIRLAEKMGADLEKLVPFRGYTLCRCGPEPGRSIRRSRSQCCVHGIPRLGVAHFTTGPDDYAR